MESSDNPVFPGGPRSLETQQVPDLLDGTPGGQEMYVNVPPPANAEPGGAPLIKTHATSLGKQVGAAFLGVIFIAMVIGVVLSMMSGTPDEEVPPEEQAAASCTDDPNFVDAIGLHCLEWEGYECSGDDAAAFSEDEKAALLESCCASCSGEPTCWSGVYQGESGRRPGGPPEPPGPCLYTLALSILRALSPSWTPWLRGCLYSR